MSRQGFEHITRAPRRAEIQTVSGVGLEVARGNKKAGEKLTTGQPEFPQGQHTEDRGRIGTRNYGTRTQQPGGLERRANVGEEPTRTPDRRRAVPDYGTEFGDGWRGLFTPACWNQEGGGLLRGAEQPRGPQADLKEEEYLPNPISHQGRSPVSQDLVVFKH
ncbi:hypothetical protein JTB14_002622 [Gonioctena quinquepunctata]|nr:hypothetical protein JTB14_002622 [Gonioctena quinquepunctata]